MESDLGKLFIGGISWDTDEDRLKEYFGGYGEVVEAVIMRDRTTGRARGFGFIIFADPSVAERVVMEKHMIDGRNVEAKKAVPRDDQQIINRTNNTINGSPGPGRTKKIFVGGLASTVTESDFKTYFDQFGTITDVVVMYDHNTQRPRGFGFISYDSEEAVDRVLHKTFHELNGKMVEVKRAVPKELSPGPSRSPLSPLIGLNYGLGRENSFLNNYVAGYNMSPVSGYGMRMDGRFNPIGNGRNGYSPFGSSGYGMGMNFESGLSPSFNGSSHLTNNLGYGRMLSPYSNGNSSRIITPIGYNASNGRNGSALTSTNRNVWGNESLNNGPISPGAYLGSGRGGFGVSFGNNGSNWGISPFSSQNAGNSLDYFSGNPEYGNGGSGYSLGGRNNGISSGHQTSSFVSSSNGYEGSYGDVYRDGSVYGDSTWRTAASELDGTGSFGYGLNNAASDVAAKSSEDYIGNYNVTNRQSNRGIAA